MRIPKGQKTPKMLEIEKRIGRTLEEDYREHYTKKGWGQTRIAHRWRVPKVLIFSSGTAEAIRRRGQKDWA